MINRLRIQNFKCFQDATAFDFSNLNLLTGINGRGKSSILQSILLISQSVDKIRKTQRLTINGRHINLGNFDDIRNSDTPRSESISFEFVVNDIINATYKFAEDENDELSAIASQVTVEITDVEELNQLNVVLSDFQDNLNERFGGNTYEELPFDTNELAFNYLISKIHYISADRLGPVKYVDKTTLNDSEFVTVGSKGEYSINVLAKQNLPLVHDQLYIGLDAKSIIQQTEEWLNYILEGAKIKIEGLDKSSSVLWMLLNNKSNSYKYKPTNMGFGYSYVLPLIVSGLIAKPDEVLIVENPEAHLHPRAQSRIAEFFAKVASCGVQVFIESHSEHILNGLRVSVLNPSIHLSPSEFNIHYFNEAFASTKLTMDDNGKIENWPEGFFDQQEIDLASIFNFNK